MTEPENRELFGALADTQATADLFNEIADERVRQYVKFGDQAGKADADPVLLDRIRTDPGGYGSASRLAMRLAEQYGIPTANWSRNLCQAEHRAEQGTWFGIAMEEVAEVLDAVAYAHAANNPDLLRAEVIQTAAVFTAWAEAITARGLSTGPGRDGRHPTT